MSNQHMHTHTHAPPGQWGQSIRFCGSATCRAPLYVPLLCCCWHTLAKLHGLLTHCALAELQNPVDTVAVTMVQMLLLAPLGWEGWHNFLCVSTATQALSLHHMDAILACDTACHVQACSACKALQLDTFSFGFR